MSVLFLLCCVVSAAAESLQGGVQDVDVINCTNGGCSVALSSEEAVTMQLQCFLGCSEEGRQLQQFDVFACVTACSEFHKELSQNCELECENNTTCIIGCRMCKEATNATGLPTPTNAPTLTLMDERVSTGPLDYMIEFPTDSDGYIIQVEDSTGHTITYIPVVDRKSSLSLSAYACQHVNVSYANVGRCSTSEYSPPVTVYVSNGIPNPPGNVEVQLEEDSRDGYLGHPTLNVTWERPSNVECVSHYSLVMSSVAHRKCVIQEISIPYIDGDANSIFIQSEDPSQIPFFNCKYELTLLSHPNTGDRVTVVFQTIFTGPRSPVNINCAADFNPESGKYDVTVKWTEGDAIIEAILFMHIRVHSPSLGYKVDSKAMQYTIPNLEPQEGLYLIQVIPQKNPTYSWRRIPSDNTCRVAAPPVPPSRVGNVTVKNMTLYDNKTLDIIVSWAPPEHPNGELIGYVMRIGRQPADKDDKHSLTVNNIETGSTHINLRGILLWWSSEMTVSYLQMRVKNKYEYSQWSLPVELNTSTMIASNSASSKHSKNDKAIVYTSIVSAILFIAIVVIAWNIVLVYVRHKFNVKQKKRSLLEKAPTGNDSTNVYHYEEPMSILQQQSCTTDKWELNPKCVTVDRDQAVMRNCTCHHNGKISRGYIDIGGGSMGHNVDWDKERTLTIKTLGDNSTEKESFMKEIKNMKKVSEADSELGRFVVNMVGCVTVQEPLMLVFECDYHGDLLTYLREKRRKSEHASSTQNGRRATSGRIGKSDLWDFAWQISGGMAFLADCGIVHGSLACHNIWMGKDKTIKIFNFGAQTRKPGSAHLRWMAPESISRHEFTTSSDVWAYGIVLWEICTMGGFPYPVISDKDLPRFLQSGHRLEQPENVPPEMYDIMTLCWSKHPYQRPVFTTLHSTTRHFFQQLPKAPTSDQEDIFVALDDLELL